MEKLAVSVTDAAAMIGISKTAMYNLIHVEGFPVKRIGGKYVVPVKALERWLENKIE